MEFAEERQALKSVEAWQLKVHEDEIGILCGDLAQDLAAVADRAQDLQPGPSFDDHLEQFAIELAAIRHHDADPCAGF
jgi:hypothetical protein